MMGGQPGEQIICKDSAVGRATRVAVGITDLLAACEQWTLRLSHPLVLFVVVAFACAQNANETQGLIAGGYMLISLGAPAPSRPTPLLRTTLKRSPSTPR
jgi:hypothetical protein